MSVVASILNVRGCIKRLDSIPEYIYESKNIKRVRTT